MMNKKELDIQLAVGSLTTLDLFLKVLKSKVNSNFYFSNHSIQKYTIAKNKQGTSIFFYKSKLYFQFDVNGNFLGVGWEF